MATATEDQGPVVYTFKGRTPEVDHTSYVHPTAVLIGDVVIGRQCYIGPGASLRGDFGRIVLEDGTNIQDNCVLHCFPDRSVTVEADGHIGHAAVLHGCHIGRGVLIGIQAVIMDDVVVGEDSIVGAMALLRAGTEYPPRSMIRGAPAEVARELTDEEIETKRKGTKLYQRLAADSLETMTRAAAMRPAAPSREE
ncbi:MAG: transferase hexapeptide repeat family protein [Alphaproteobacteria bacterium]|nr:transferase hexapeptide repeat family protein [Alphaproteobacteria bacterium]